jgi:hypothetical protein
MSTMSWCQPHCRRLVVAGNIMQGARGGADLPPNDIDRVKSHLAKYYAKMGDEAPLGPRLSWRCPGA